MIGFVLCNQAFAAGYTLTPIAATGFANIRLNAINDMGLAIGTAVQNGVTQAARWQPSTGLQILPNLPGTFLGVSDVQPNWQPQFINHHGAILGFATTAISQFCEGLYFFE